MTTILTFAVIALFLYLNKMCMRTHAVAYCWSSKTDLRKRLQSEASAYLTAIPAVFPAFEWQVPSLPYDKTLEFWHTTPGTAKIHLQASCIYFCVGFGRA